MHFEPSSSAPGPQHKIHSDSSSVEICFFGQTHFPVSCKSKTVFSIVHSHSPAESSSAPAP